LTPNKFNPNDPSLWKDFDPFEKSSDYVDGKSEARINRSKSASDKKGNKGFSNTMKGVAAERNQTAEYVEKYQVGMANRDNTYQAESNARPEVKEKISKALKDKPKTNEHKQALKSTTTNRYGDANYEAAHKAGLAKRDKPFHAGEYGIFQSRSEAAKYAIKQGLKNALKKFEAWSKSKPQEYYFIKEEK
jgi:hypothetical protein